MKKLLSLMVSAGTGLWLATVFIVGVAVKTSPGSSFFGIRLEESWKFFIVFGVILGLLNYFVKPVLNTITLPLRIITLGLFGFIINMFLIWVVDMSFAELTISGIYPLLLTSLAIWVIGWIISAILVKKED